VGRGPVNKVGRIRLVVGVVVCALLGLAAAPIRAAAADPLPTVTQIAAGSSQSCSLLSDTTAQCWGANESGQLGDGTTTERSAPTTVLNAAGTAPLTGITQIATGTNTCALLADQTVDCWGVNLFGGLGIGTTTGPQACGTAPCSALPVVVENSAGTGPLNGVIRIAVGPDRACAILSDHTLSCWGAQISTINTESVDPLPVQVPLGDAVTPLTNVSDASIGLTHMCALLLDGTADCWGDGFSGDLGNGSTTGSGYASFKVLDSAGDAPLTGIAQVAAGDHHSCARMTTGAVQCWGLGGALGDTTSNGPQDLPIVVQNDDGSGALASAAGIVAAGNTTCANLTDGTARCWGSDLSWLLGDGGVAVHPGPGCIDCSAGAIAVESHDGTGLLSGIVVLASEDADHVCALLGTGAIQCWGGNQHSQLGDGTTVDRCVPVTAGSISPADVAPDAPTDASATLGDRSATIFWTPPTHAVDDCRLNFSYTLTASPGGEVYAPQSSFLLSGSGTTTGTVFTGLTPGISYTFTVAAINAAGTGAPSAPSNAVTPVAIAPIAPDPPTNVTAVAGDREARVSWDTPADNGAAIIFYSVRATDLDESGVAEAPANSAVVPGLVNGDTYSFTVTATNSAGTSDVSVVSNAVTPDSSLGAAPDAPINVTAVGGRRAATVSWNPPINDGLSNIGSYTVTAAPGGHSVTTPDLTATFTDLTVATSYTFTVTATNDIGTSPPSIASNAVIPTADVPGAPSSVLATADNRAAKLVWQPPLDDGGSPITSYTFTAAPGGAHGSVVATNDIGTGAALASNTVTPTGPPDAPAGVIANASHGVVSVSWTASAVTHGSPVSTYSVRAFPGNATVTVSAAHTNATFSTLLTGTYRFQVRASNGFGAGAFSAVSNAVSVVHAQGDIGNGYWMAGADGRVYGFGSARAFGVSPGTAVAIAGRTNGSGYWTVDAFGDVSHFGATQTYGPAPALFPGELVSTISGTPAGNGYWLFTNRGRAFAYGKAGFYGDMSGVALNGPIVASVATPTGHGYFMVGSDGGVFSFGDAHFHGSTGGMHLNRPIVGIAPTPNNQGYWLVASDGGVFAFAAPFRGSMGGTQLNQPVNGLVAYGNGYLMVAGDGGTFDFSNKAFLGSLAGTPPSAPIVGIAAFS
jgi:alpha-tubulin suppressor-like RCC1 family protein